MKSFVRCIGFHFSIGVRRASDQFSGEEWSYRLEETQHEMPRDPEIRKDISVDEQAE